MDWLDKVSIAALVAITVATVGMLSQHIMKEGWQNNPGEGSLGEKDSYASQIEVDKQIYQDVASYMEQGLYAEAMSEIQGIMKQYPENPLSYVYLAKLHLAEGELGGAIQSYRRAVEMEPDYVDERTPLFIGDKIKVLVAEGRVKFGREKALKPKDENVRKVLKDIYYLQSRLAGGCE